MTHQGNKIESYTLSKDIKIPFKCCPAFDYTKFHQVFFPLFQCLAIERGSRKTTVPIYFSCYSLTYFTFCTVISKQRKFRMCMGIYKSRGYGKPFRIYNSVCADF